MIGEQEKLWSKKFILLTVCNLLLFLNLQMILPAFPAYVKETFYATDFTISLVTSLFALSAIVTRLFAGELLKQGKITFLLFTGLVIAALSTAGYYWCGTIAVLLVMRVCYGIGFGMSSTTFPTMVSHVIPIRRMGEGMGYFGLSTSLAMSIAPMIGLWVLATYGFGTLTASSTMLILLIFPLLYLVLPKQKSVAAENAEPTMQTDAKASITQSVQESVPSNSRSPFLDKNILLPCLLNLLLSVTYGGLLSFLALFGKEIQIDNVGNFFLFNALAILCIRPLSGKIFDQKGHVSVLIPGALFVIAGLLALSFTTGMIGLICSAVLYGLGYGTLQPSMQAWIIKEVSPDKRGMANAAFLNSIDLGVAIGSMLLGVVASSANYAIMYRISALAMVTYLLVYLFFLMTRGKRMKRELAKHAENVKI
ncbi:MFS transporter [Brevibacillus laterosporus]|uniref:MFS transporter n=1 Tax=Brevibacillus laterosporus TaxID=1465 RepID=UPI000B9BB40F|nr:MFS transporter [Brevibacillus laterosporus]